MCADSWALIQRCDSPRLATKQRQWANRPERDKRATRINDYTRISNESSINDQSRSIGQNGINDDSEITEQDEVNEQPG